MFRPVNKNFSRSGVAALPTILLSSLIIMELVAAGILIAYLLNLSSLGVRRANETLAAAQAGVLDMEMRITRNKDLGNMTSSLSFSDNLLVNVTTTQDISGKYQIISTGSVKVGGVTQFSRTLQATLNVNTSTGKVELQSLQETY